MMLTSLYEHVGKEQHHGVINARETTCWKRARPSVPPCPEEGERDHAAGVLCHDGIQSPLCGVPASELGPPGHPGRVSMHVQHDHGTSAASIASVHRGHSLKQQPEYTRLRWVAGWPVRPYLHQSSISGPGRGLFASVFPSCTIACTLGQNHRVIHQGFPFPPLGSVRLRGIRRFPSFMKSQLMVNSCGPTPILRTRCCMMPRFCSFVSPL
jgi:hypothetical protein